MREFVNHGAGGYLFIIKLTPPALEGLPHQSENILLLAY